MAREEARRLLGLVPDQDLPTLTRILRALAIEPVSTSFTYAAEGKEDIAPGSFATFARADADIVAGKVLSHEEVMRILLEPE
jgi:hypothetical protein